MAHRMNTPGCACCCPSCVAPVPTPTGSTSANSAWYLTPDDPDDITHQDRASYHAIRDGATKYIDTTDVAPTSPWAKWRLYFAYKDADNHVFAEMWGVFTLVGGGASYYVFHTRVCVVDGGVEAEVATHQSDQLSFIFSPEAFVMAATYDQATGIARVVCIIQRSAASAWRTYTYFQLGSGYSYYSPDLGLRYGWGYGDIAGSPTLTYSTPFSNLRHVDHCQGFPHLFSQGASTFNHPWIKSSLLATETWNVDADGISGCSACNNVQSLYRKTNAFFTGDQTTFDMLSDPIQTTWTGTLPSTLGGFAIDWLIYYHLTAGRPFIRPFTTLSIIGLYHYNVGGKDYYEDLGALASRAILFEGTCEPPQYDARDAIDDLVFDDWTLYDFSGWPARGGSSGVPDLSGVEAVLSIP